jgi:charged multivesicular body protein 1
MTAVMDGFEKSFNDLDVVDEYTREATSSATAVGTPQDDVDRLMNQTADKVGVELTQDLEDATPANTKLAAPEHDENALGDRLRALRN